MVSIDCGATGTYTESSITWTGDSDIMQTGEVYEVQVSGIPQYMSTLRAFTTRKKNCYTIDAVEGTRYLVRAIFYYGNYDKKASPPTFDLHFDGNYWTSVTTSMEIPYLHEVIYTAKKDSISVCLAQTYPKMFPFINSLEVRTLASGMYGKVDNKFGMVLSLRLAFGTTKFVRYPDDPYDRIWIPLSKPGVFTDASSDASSINISDIPDEPPAAVLQNAIVARNTSAMILLSSGLDSTAEVDVYASLYFSEVSDLLSDEVRSISLSVDDKLDNSLIVPPYGGVEQKILQGKANSNTTVYLRSTSSSTLPPLVNAFEVYRLTDELTDGTSSDDGQYF